MRQVGRYDKALKKVVWSSYDDTPPESLSPNVIEDSMDPVCMVGLPPPKTDQLPNGKSTKVYDQMVDSKSRRRELLRAHGMVEMGNDAPDVVKMVREKRQHERETRT